MELDEERLVLNLVFTVEASRNDLKAFLDGVAPVLRARAISAQSYDHQGEADAAAQLAPVGALCEVWHIDLEEEVFTRLASYSAGTPTGDIPTALTFMRHG